MNDKAAFYLLKHGQKSGPFTLEQVQDKLKNHEITITHMVSSDGGRSWQKLFQLDALDKNALNIGKELPKSPDEVTFDKSQAEVEDGLKRTQHTTTTDAIASLAKLGSLEDKKTASKTAGADSPRPRISRRLALTLGAMGSVAAAAIVVGVLYDDGTPPQAEGTPPPTAKAAPKSLSKAAKKRATTKRTRTTKTPAAKRPPPRPRVRTPPRRPSVPRPTPRPSPRRAERRDIEPGDRDPYDEFDQERPSRRTVRRGRTRNRPRDLDNDALEEDMDFEFDDDYPRPPGSRRGSRRRGGDRLGEGDEDDIYYDDEDRRGEDDAPY